MREIPLTNNEYEFVTNSVKEGLVSFYKLVKPKKYFSKNLSQSENRSTRPL